MKTTFFRSLSGRVILFIALLPLILPAQVKRDHSLRFSVSFPESLSSKALDGRLLLLISSDSSREPRFQISDGPRTQLVFGRDVDGLKPGEAAVLDSSAFGYPLRSITALPSGTYHVQALLHRYETFHRADGHVLKLPQDRGEGQQWNRAPGNLYSSVRDIYLDPARDTTIAIVLDNKIPPITPPADTRYIKHLRIKSDLLSTFWGRPVYLVAQILLPYGYEDHPRARYPLLIVHDHFSYDFRSIRETPPDADADGRMRRWQEYAYKNFQDWIAPDTPRMIAVRIQHANPYYDDSYAVNSANVGPYGDAIIHELIPAVEKEFRCIGSGWSRYLCGGSTGGWAALAVQIFYPDQYNGCWAGCPDPVDFRSYQIVNIYQDKNAYFLDSPWKKTPRPGQRDWLGHISSTMADQNHLELALGTRARSGGQWDIWQAVFGPVGRDGYPKPIWDKLSGEINHQVALYWREHYDLRYILQRDWSTLGPKLAGKIHISIGDMDSFYLNNAVYLMEKFLESTSGPYYAGSVSYGDRKVHCWSGEMVDRKTGKPLSYLAWHARVAEERALQSATAGCDTLSWRY